MGGGGVTAVGQWDSGGQLNGDNVAHSRAGTRSERCAKRLMLFGWNAKSESLD